MVSGNAYVVSGRAHVVSGNVHVISGNTNMVSGKTDVVSGITNVVFGSIHVISGGAHVVSVRPGLGSGALRSDQIRPPGDGVYQGIKRSASRLRFHLKRKKIRLK